LGQAKDVSVKRDQILAAYNAISSDNLTRLGKIVPASFNSVTFANHLNTIASKYGIIIEKMQIVEQDNSNGQVVAPTADSYMTKIVSFSVKGQYPTFMNFLKDLESGLYLVNVTGLSIKKDQSDKTGSTFEFDVTLNTYSLQ
jgi:Tfp pilus assembly protein PilO